MNVKVNSSHFSLCNRSLMLLLLFSLIMRFSFANDAVSLFEKGNELYKKSQYDSALSAYQKASESGMISAELYFNMGNSAYKLKRTAAAILYYEKALKLAPGDEDATFNLGLANLLIVDKIAPLPTLFYQRWIQKIASLMDADTWSKLSVAMVWLALITAVLFVLSQNAGAKKIFFFSSFLLLLLTFTFYYLGGVQFEANVTQHEAIIFESSAYVKSSPDEKGTDLFILHEGVKVSVLDEIGEWRRIRVANGSEGWIHSEVMKLI